MKRCKNFDQRFHEKKQEHDYKQSLETNLLQRGSVLCSLATIVSILYLLWLVGAETNREDRPFTFSTFVEPRTVVMMKILLTTVLSLMLLICARLRLKFGFFLRWNWEGVMTAWCMWLLISNAFLPARLMLMLGAGTDAFGYDTKRDSETELLLLVSILAAILIYLPIRTCCLWLPAATGFITSLAMDLVFRITYGREDDYLLVFFTLYALLSGAYGHESNSRAKWLANHTVVEQEGQLASRHAAVCTLLAMLCDCFVQLGPELEILEPSSRLTAMLFHLNDQSLVGRKLTDFLPDDQRCRTEQLKAMDPGRSEMLPLSLKDVSGRKVATHAYFTRFEDNLGSHFLMGIVENQEACDAVPARDLPSFSPITDRSVLRQISDTASESGESNDLDLDADGEVIRVKVHVSKDLPILGYSTAFGSISGPMEDGQSLADMLHEDDVHDFSKWLGETLLEHFVQLPTFSGLRLCPPNATARGSLLVVENTSLRVLGEHTSGQIMAELGFEDIRKKKLRRKSSLRGRSDLETVLQAGKVQL